MERESLLQRIFQDQRTGYHALTGLDAGHDLLHVASEHVSAANLDAVAVTTTSSPAALPVRSDVNRGVFGFEKTFFDGTATMQA